MESAAPQRTRQSARARAAAFILFSVLLSFVLNFKIEITPLASGDDETRAWAATYAAVSGMAFGRDIVFTHGPLMYLTDRCPDIGSAVPIAIAGSAIAPLAAGFGAYLFVSGLGFTSAATTLFLLWLLNVSIAIPGPRTEDNYFLIVLTFVLAALLRKDRLPCLIAGSVLSAACALIKLSLGIGVLGALLVATTLAHSRRNALRDLGIVAGTYGTSLALLWTSLGQSLTSLPSFLFNGYAIMEGYPYSLGMDVGGGMNMAAKYAGVVLLLIGWALWMRTPASMRLAAVIAFPMFVAFKHSVVRMGPVHVLHFAWIVQMFVVALALYGLANHRAVSSVLVGGTALVVLQLAPLGTTWKQNLKGSTLKDRFLEAAALIGRPGVESLQVLANLSSIRAATLAAEIATIQKHRLPTGWREEIGNAAVDVWSQDLMPIPANALAYQPRPTITTIIAASARADDLDAEFLNSARGTPYLFMNPAVEGIGGEHLFWSEPKSFFTIFNRYDVVKRTDDYAAMLLKRRSAERFTAARHVGSKKSGQDGSVPIPSIETGELLYGTFRTPITSSQKIRTFFLKPDVFVAELEYEDGMRRRFKFFPTNSEHGLLLSPVPWTNNQLAVFLESRTGPHPVSVRLLRTRGRREYPFMDFNIDWHVYSEHP